VELKLRRRVLRILSLKVSRTEASAALFCAIYRNLIATSSRLSQMANAMSDDFEVSIFLTELSSRHSVLTKQKIFKDKARIQSNSGKLTNWLTTGTSDQPVLINEDALDPMVIREEEDDAAVNLADIPEANELQKPARRSARDKRRREDLGHETVSTSSDSEDSGLFVPARSAKRSKTEDGPADAGEDGINEDLQDDKKKLGMNTSYDGFSIYGRILCLVVKRRGPRTTGGAAAPASSAQMLETWVSTQAAAEQVDDDEDGG
jgi:hypothetical protein